MQSHRPTRHVAGYHARIAEQKPAEIALQPSRPPSHLPPFTAVASRLIAATMSLKGIVISWG